MRPSFFILVRVEGLEPPRLAAPEPKSGASTNSATPAKMLLDAFHATPTFEALYQMIPVDARVKMTKEPRYLVFQ